MRRPPPPVALQPSLLKHFLIISIALTSCLAIFASGENAEVIQDTIKERQAKNRALAADKQNGKVRVVGGMVIAKGTNIDQGGGGEPSGTFTDANSSGGSQYSPPPAPAQPAYAGPDDPSLFGPDGKRLKPGQKPKGPPKLSETDIEKILAASRERSGVAAAE